MLEETKCQYSVHTQYEEQLINMFYFSTHLIMSPLYLAIVFYAIYSRWTNRNSLMFWQKWFLLLLSLGSFLRSVYFATQPFTMLGIYSIPVKIRLMILVGLPNIFFLGIYLIVLFLWLDVYVQSRKEWKVNIRTCYIIVYSIVMTALTIIVSFDFSLGFDTKNTSTGSTQTSNVLEKGFFLFLCGLYVITSIAFVFLSIKFANMLSGASALRYRVQLLQRKITILTLVVVGSFILRTIIITLHVIYPCPITEQAYWMDIVYYFFLEVVPLGTVVVILYEKIGSVNIV
eukprot:TRINITY_DN1863_c0_g1_i2.p1 TRINITY_DN1863_c0_g1~~TRINITY_DN1863_c0_g1_i2.p1  ORF type:complete len:287 (-),score=8.37 TRINITY_DN1863_c0_g1_i2:26-886(-)